MNSISQMIAAPSGSAVKGLGEKLSRKTMFFYGLAEMPLQVASLAVVAYLPNYYGSDLGISLVFVANALLIARLFDAVTDPLIGYLSDKTRTRWGRRRIWMLASIPILMLSVYKLFLPQPPVDGAYFLTWIVVLWLGWTMLQIPYYAWGAELSADYNERSVLVGWRTSLGLIANVGSKLVPVFALLAFAYGGTRKVLEMIGIAMLIVTPCTVILAVWRAPERANFNPVSIPLGQGLRLMARNGPFKRLVIAFFLSTMGAAFSTSTVLFYVRSVLREESAGILVLFIYYVSSLCAIPFWIWLSRRFGKHRVLCAALLMYWVCAGYMFLGPGDLHIMMVIMAITGFAGSCTWIMPNSMKADVIDLDTARSRERRAAWFFAVWALTIKIAQSIGPWLALMLLSLWGFDSTPLAVNTPEHLLGVRLMFSLVCPIFYTLAAIIIFRYPLTKVRHTSLRSAIARREQRRGSAAVLES